MLLGRSLLFLLVPLVPGLLLAFSACYCLVLLVPYFLNVGLVTLHLFSVKFYLNILLQRFIVQREDENSKNEANSEQLIEIGDAKGNQKSGELGSSESQETEENQPDPSSNSLKRKKKDRGQNKKRPRTVPLLKRNERLCPSLARNNATCDDKEKCQFIHDIQEYLKNKPADIGEDCINFKLTGKCPYGLECRFAKCHISDDLANIIDYEKYDAELEESRRKEIHHQKDLQISLRKRKFQFPKSAIYLKRLNEGFKEANVSISQNLSEGGENIQLSAREKKKVCQLVQIFYEKMNQRTQQPS